MFAFSSPGDSVLGPWSKVGLSRWVRAGVETNPLLEWFWIAVA